jgi:hypothetical protein
MDMIEFPIILTLSISVLSFGLLQPQSINSKEELENSSTYISNYIQGLFSYTLNSQEISFLVIKSIVE